MYVYTVHDLTDPIRIVTGDIGNDPLGNAINDAFRYQLPYACLDDLPYAEYNRETQELNIDNEVYEVSKDVQEYLKEADNLFHNIPVPKIELKTLTLKMIHPDETNKKGMIQIECINPPIR